MKSVFHGAYRKEVFEKAGLFNESLGRTEKIMKCIIVFEKQDIKFVLIQILYLIRILEIHGVEC